MNFTDKEKRQIRLVLFIITCALLINAFLQNMLPVLGFIKLLLSMVTPFLISLGVAFLLNMPMTMIENKLLAKLPFKKSLRRTLAILLTILLVFGVIGFILTMIVPQLISSVQIFISNIPEFINKLETLMKGQDWAQPFLGQITKALQEIQRISVLDYLKTWLSNDTATIINRIFNSLLGTVSSVFSGFITVFLVFVFSIYTLSSKETLSRQGKELLYSTLPEADADRVMYVGYTAYDNFHNFFTGQFLEAMLLGVMNFIGMSILQLPYAPVISVLISFGALIPMIGAVLAGLVGILIILTASPVDAISYAIFIVILQQFDGNLTYPRIVGKSLGLPALWVLFSVTVGAAIFGILGMLLFVPLASTTYDLLTDYKTRQLVRRNIDVRSK